MNVPPKGDAFKRVGAYFAQFQVTQQPVPNLTVRVAEGSFWNGNNIVEFSGGNSAVFTVPGAGLAKWVLVALTGNGAIQLVNGSTATSNPPAPAVPGGYFPLAYVYIVNGTTAITQDMIMDERPLWVVDSAYLPLLGGTLTGPLILAADPTAALGAATKQYVDNGLLAKVDFTSLNNALLLKADIGGTPSEEFVLNQDWVGAPSSNVFLTIERGTLPNVSIRWNETSDSWELTTDGSTYSVITTSGSLAAYLPLVGGTLTGPLVLAADPVLPLGATTKQYVDAAIAGVGSTYVDVAGDTMTGALLHPAGTAAAPSISFSGGAGFTNKGWYSSASGEMSAAIGGVQKVKIDATGITVFSGFFAPGTGGVGAPEFSFTGDTTTGLYRAAAGQIGVASGGVNVATFTAAGMTVVGSLTATSLNVTGPSAADLNMGGFKITNLGTATGGGDATNKTYVDTADGTKVNKTDTLALTGDVTVPASALTGPANSFAATLANTAVAAGSYGSASAVGTFTVDAKGRLTLAATTPIAILAAAVTDFSTAADARIAAAVGVSVQAWDADLDAVAAIGAGSGFVRRNAGVWSVSALTGGEVNTALGYTAADAARLINTTAGDLTGGGDLTADRTLALATTAVTPGAYGSASAVGTFTVDSKGRLTLAATTPIAILAAAVTDFSTAVTAEVAEPATQIVYGTGTDIDSASTFTYNSATGDFKVNFGFAAVAAPGDITVLGADGTLANDGGDVYIQGGNSVTGAGGDITLAAGTGGVTGVIQLAAGFTLQVGDDLSIGGTPGTAGQLIRSAGAGSPPAWTTLMVKGTQAVTFGAIAASSTGTSTNTVTVTGAVVGDVVSLGLDATGGAAGFMYSGYVSAADTVTIRAANSGTGGVGAGAADTTINVVVTKYANV